MDFPSRVSLTITNYCNLRCRMCGQWSEEGYVRGNTAGLKNEMSLAEWKRVVDELNGHLPDGRTPVSPQESVSSSDSQRGVMSDDVFR